MNLYSRAGLVWVFVTYTLFTFSAAAPIPAYDHGSRADSLLRRVDADSQVIQRSEHSPAVIQYPVYLGRTDVAPSSDIPIARDELVYLVRRKSIFTKIKEGFHKMAQGIKHVAQKVASGIKHVAQKVASGVKTAVKKVGHFVKTTGAKIAKFGLKLYSAAAAVASKVLNFVPVIGKPLSKLADGASAAANAASNAIHVKLPGKLEHGVRVLDKVRKITGYIPRDLDSALQEEVLERDGVYEDVTFRAFVPSDGNFDERDGFISGYDAPLYMERGWEDEDDLYFF